MLVLTDRGILARADIGRSQGEITSIDLVEFWTLKASTGDKLTRGTTDSEGLAVSGNTIYVSFEGSHRVASYATPDAPAQVLTHLAMFDGLELNKSLEALAIDPQERLYAIPEGGRDAQGMIPVYRRDAKAWSVPFALPPSGNFAPVGADFGPDGRLYLLERAFSVLGFRTQLRRWEIGADGPSQETTLIRTAWGTHDNLEGVSVWRDPQGVLRATMIADDNFNALQKTEIVEYTLPK